MNCYLSTNSLVDAIGTRSCYMKESELRNWIKLSRQSLENFQLKRTSFLICFICSMVAIGTADHKILHCIIAKFVEE